MFNPFDKKKKQRDAAERNLERSEARLREMQAKRRDSQKSLEKLLDDILKTKKGAQNGSY